MNWLNLEVSTIRKAEYVGSEPVQRATWLNVLAYCAEHENGGRIVGARKWKDRTWQQTCGVMLAEVDGAGDLLTWDGEDLLIWNYPEEKEDEVKTLREMGRATSERKAKAARLNGQKGGRPRTHGETDGETESTGDQKPTETQAGDSSKENPTEKPTETHGEPIERKGSRREVEGNEKGMEVEPPPPPALPPAPPGGGGKAKPESALPTTPESQRISTLFRKRLDTEWAAKDIATFKELWKAKLLTDENISALEAYYASERAKGDTGPDRGTHRRDLSTFLNNFRGELDRARAWQEGADKPKAKPAAANPHLQGARVV